MYHEEAITGKTDASGNLTIQLGPVLQYEDVYFIGYVTAECADGSSANYRLVNPLTQGKLGGFGGQMAVVGPMYLKPQQYFNLVISGGPPNTVVAGSLVGDVSPDPAQLTLRPIPTAAGANVGLPTFPNITVTGLADFQGPLQAEGPARFKGPDPWYDVTHPAWGADPTGAADSTVAIQSALTAVGLSGGIAFFPPGSYKISASLTLPKSVILQGAGFLQTILKPTAAIGAHGVLELLAPAIATGGIQVRDLRVTGVAGVQSAISLAHLTAVELKNVFVDGIYDVDGVHGSDLESSSINQCFFNVSGAGTIAINLLSTSNNNRIRDCEFVADAVTSMSAIVLAPGVTQTVIEGNDFEGSSSGNVGIQAGGTVNTTIAANFFENWTGAAVAANTATGCRNLVIHNNNLHALAAAAAMIVLSSAGPNDFVEITQNTFSLLGNGGQCALGILAGLTTNLYVRGNRPGTGSAGTQVISVNGVIQPHADWVTVGMVSLNNDLRRSSQSPSEATLVAGVDATLGEHCFVNGLTAARVVGAPLNGAVGQELTFHFLQAGAGGFNVTFNAAFLRVSFSNAGNAVNTRSSITFVCLDGVNWLQVGAQKVWS